MAVGPVQLITLGFPHPNFHGEIIAELERLRDSDTVRVIDALAVYKDDAGDVEVVHLSNLTRDEAVELGRVIGALIGLGEDGEEGMEAGAAAGGERAADGDEPARRCRGLGHPGRHPERFRGRACPAGTPVGRPAAECRYPGRRLPDQRRVHQPAGSDRGRPALRRGGRGPARPGNQRCPCPTGPAGRPGLERPV